jgi:hypothetical protein
VLPPLPRLLGLSLPQLPSALLEEGEGVSEFLNFIKVMNVLEEMGGLVNQLNT